MSLLEKLQKKYAAHQAGGDVITAGIKNAEKFLLVATVLTLSRSFVRHSDHHHHLDFQRSTRRFADPHQHSVGRGFDERYRNFCVGDGIGSGHNYRSDCSRCVVRGKPV